MGLSLKNLSMLDWRRKLYRCYIMYVGLCKLQIVDGSQY